MNSFFKSLRSNMIAQAVLSLLLGVVFVAMPGMSTVTMVYIVASWFALAGIAALVAYFGGKSGIFHTGGVLANGICLALIAVLMFAFPMMVAGFFTTMFGILVLISGFVNISRAIQLRSYAASAIEWVLAVILGVLVVLGGVCILVNPFGAAVSLTMVMGIMFIVKGIADLIIEWRISRVLKDR